MKTRFFVPAFLLIVSPSLLAGDERKGIAGDEKKGIDATVDLSYLTKTWGLECISQKVKHNKVKVIEVEKGTPFGIISCNACGGSSVTFLLEFKHDVENLEQLRKAFTARRPGFLAPKYPDAGFLLYFFDSENVVVDKTPPNRIKGEITGKKGDAFQLIITHISEENLKKTAKIVARPGEKAQK